MEPDSVSGSRDDGMGGAERRARDQVRALGTPTADPDFRARLAADFASGTLASAPRPSSVLRLPWHAREMTRWAVAAAAAAALIVAGLMLNRGPSYRIVSQHGSGIASVDGHGVTLNDLASLERTIHPGSRIALPADGDLMLQAGNTMMVAIERGSVVTLPGTPGRWFARRVAGRVDSGILRVTTGPGFHGAALALRTPEAQVQVTGTTFAVICEPAGTCVCVLEGMVHVGPIGAAMMEIPGGLRGYVYANGAPMVRATMRPDERVMLGELRERRDRHMGAGAH